MISASTKGSPICSAIAAGLPEGPWLYPEDQTADIPMRQLAAEITREKLYLRLHEELPYSSRRDREVEGAEGWLVAY